MPKVGPLESRRHAASSQAPGRTYATDEAGKYSRRLIAVLLLIIVSSLAIAALDHVSWAANGYQTSSYNGSTLRSYRELVRRGGDSEKFVDSWGAIGKAIAVLNSPDGERLYEKVFFDDKVKFQYPPTSIVYFYALDSLGLMSAATLNGLNMVVFLLGCGGFGYLLVQFAAESAGTDRLARYWPVFALAVVAALLFYPAFRGFELGQVQVWINTAFTFALIAWMRGAKAIAGALIAFAATIKPQLGIFLIWALLWGEWRFLIGFLLLGLTVGLSSLALFGVHNHLAYLDVLSFLSRHGEAYFPNNSVNGIVNRALDNGDNLVFDAHGFPPYQPLVWAATLVSSLALLACALWPAVRKRSARPGLLDISIVAICATLASPISWEHHYGLVLPAFGIALAVLAQAPLRIVPLILLSLAWMVAANYLPATNRLADTPFNFVQAYLFFAGLILLGLIAWMPRDGELAKLARPGAADRRLA